MNESENAHCYITYDNVYCYISDKIANRHMKLSPHLDAVTLAAIVEDEINSYSNFELLQEISLAIEEIYGDKPDD